MSNKKGSEEKERTVSDAIMLVKCMKVYVWKCF